MKPITYFPLYNYYFKYLGLILSLLGLTLFLVSDSEFEILIYLGLLIIAFAKEKTESQYTVNARNEVFKSIFGFYLSLMITLNIVQFITSDFLFQPGTLIYIGLPLILYLMVFYISLIFKVNLDSSVDLSENIGSHRILYIIMVLAIILISSVYLIIKFS